MAGEGKPGIAWQDTAVGLGIIALAGIVAWQTAIIPENAIYAKVGPKVFPWISALMLAVMGAALTFARPLFFPETPRWRVPFAFWPFAALTVFLFRRRAAMGAGR